MSDLKSTAPNRPQAPSELQSEHDQPENLVEVPGEAEQAARSLQDAADSHATLQGFFAINNERPPETAAKEEDQAPDQKKR